MPAATAETAVHVLLVSGVFRDFVLSSVSVALGSVDSKCVTRERKRGARVRQCVRCTGLLLSVASQFAFPVTTGFLCVYKVQKRRKLLCMSRNLEPQATAQYSDFVDNWSGLQCAGTPQSLINCCAPRSFHIDHTFVHTDTLLFRPPKWRAPCFCAQTSTKRLFVLNVALFSHLFSPQSPHLHPNRPFRRTMLRHPVLSSATLKIHRRHI
jgi:hypothetical protein